MTDIRISTASTHHKQPNIPHRHGKPDDINIVARFRREDRPADEGHAIACSHWEMQLENVRSIALYAKPKRLAERCGLTTADSEFEMTRLPAGDEDATSPGVIPVGSEPDHDPHEVLRSPKKRPKR